MDQNTTRAEHPINPRAIAWFKARGISEATVKALQIYSGRRAGADVEPNEAGEVLCFPYFEAGAVCAIKYREPGKKFSQRPNPHKTFFNSEALDAPELRIRQAALVICEGEMDVCACVEAGYPWAVSVPDGAPPARDAAGHLIAVPEGADDIDPAQDTKYTFIYNNLAKLLAIPRVVIATDADEPGQRLAAELVRRIGRPACSFVTWPPGCKDMNDVLMRLGPDAVRRVIEDAKPYPVSGVYGYADLPEEEPIFPVSTGWGSVDEFLKVYRPALLVVTGRAGHGKSTWTQQLVAQIAGTQGWPCAIASFEMRIRPFVTDALGAAYLGRPRMDWDKADHTDVEGFLARHFVFIIGEPEDKEPHSIEWLLKKAANAVVRHGVKVLLIDPWNEIEHCREKSETTTEYTNRAVMMLKAFARQYQVLVIIVAHPTKSGAQKDPRDLTGYDISDSAAFQNKADQLVVVARCGDDFSSNQTAILVRKVRYQPDAGTLGAVELAFDRRSRLFM